MTKKQDSLDSQLLGPSATFFMVAIQSYGDKEGAALRDSMVIIQKTALHC